MGKIRDTRFGNDSLDIIPKAQATRTIYKLDLMKNKPFSKTYNPHNKRKGPTESKGLSQNKTLAHHIQDKKIIDYPGLLQSNSADNTTQHNKIYVLMPE